MLVNRNKVVSAELRITSEYVSLILNLTDGLIVTVEEITYEPDTWDITSWAELGFQLSLLKHQSTT